MNATDAKIGDATSISFSCSDGGFDEIRVVEKDCTVAKTELKPSGLTVVLSLSSSESCVVSKSSRATPLFPVAWRHT